MIRNLITFLIWLFIQAPATILGIAVIPILLTCGWKGYSTLWGNDKWGDATTHPDHTSKTFFDRFNWLALRNPTSNLGTRYLSVEVCVAKEVVGNLNIGDKKAGGFYRVLMCANWPRKWEYYYIKPYSIFGSKRCIYFRSGWKINGGRIENGKVAFVFAVNPIKPYLGI